MTLMQSTQAHDATPRLSLSLFLQMTALLLILSVLSAADLVLDLSEHFRPDIRDRHARVIVFSDPEGDVAIQSLRFDRKPK
ncbi:MAG: hypothetical protein IT428_09700 [Planctomycetaceae bacterium]|nr:hypothetical protein [Planctomycetaceae bacterium]